LVAYLAAPRMMMMFVELVEWILFLSLFSIDNKSINQAINQASKQRCSQQAENKHPWTSVDIFVVG